MKYNRQAGISLLFIFAMLSGCRSQYIPKPIENYSFKWETVYYKGRKMIKIGNFQLLFPISLPDRIKPLGNLGLLGEYSDEHNSKRLKVTTIEIFFKASQENKVHQWASTLKNIDLWIPNKAVSGKPLYESNTYISSWRNIVEVNLSNTKSYSHIIYSFMAGKNEINKKLAIKNAKGMTASSVGNVSTLYENFSPIIRSKRVISLEIVYQNFN